MNGDDNEEEDKEDDVEDPVTAFLRNRRQGFTSICGTKLWSGDKRKRVHFKDIPGAQPTSTKIDSVKKDNPNNVQT